MRKIRLSLMAIMLFLAFNPIALQAESSVKSVPAHTGKAVMSEKANALLTRLDEINALDKSNLSSLEKKEMRKEVRAVKEELKAEGGGVYLSVGALILVIILLIVLL
ncbi:hypothetical protein P872_24545 [Rhodonellum psychrophilum GCM71 = DSM 17998]|uniref:Seryl-tRNA synthetase n=2 Tax=Rhodonellum TaxID=336827 RepID=U5BVB2_9BACT|nr:MULTISPECIES: hypothetical protein [Rhodonellum]ERM84590.1 hypothetical protein P872_24545 [Rhodonellum psychrophilum GCM71 = DSM 17998]SDY85993.1 hypothetical protein SAMN05444412_103173 [Rhodonellum ikkaensis]